MGDVRVGTCSWTDPTLIESGRFYPKAARSAEGRLRYYASQFSLVEVDSSYYALPSEQTSGLWVDRAPQRFLFDIKAFRLFTHHPTPVRALPQDVRDRLPASEKEKSHVYGQRLPEDLLANLWSRFARALLPLDSAGKLGVVLLQFPPWFRDGQQQRNYIRNCVERLPQYRIAVEFRHSSWLTDSSRKRTLDFLCHNDVAFVCVDEPQGFQSSIPPVVEATSDIALVRFHGRNAETWEKQGLTPAERFNYLYTEDELKWWARRIGLLAAQTRQVHVLFNNCYADKAVVNARQMKLMLD